jgi:hypothetical protein
MFPSKVAVYNDNDLLGTAATTAQANFDTAHPLYRQIATLAAARKGTPALTGGLMKQRASGEKPGLFVVSRFDPATGKEVVLSFKTGKEPVSANVAIDPASLSFSALAGQCPLTAAAPGTITISLPGFGYAVCAAKD